MYVIHIYQLDRHSLRCVTHTHCWLSEYSKLFTRFSQPSDTGEVSFPFFHCAATSCFPSFASSDHFLCALCLQQGNCHHGSDWQTWTTAEAKLVGREALNEMRKRKGAFVNWRSDWDGGCVLDCTAGWWSYNWLWWFVLREVCLKEQNANSQSLTWWLLLLSQFQKLELAVLHQPAQVGVVLLPGHQASCFSLTKEREVPALLTLVSTSWKHYVKVAVKFVRSGRRLFLLGCTSTKREFLKLIILFPNMQQIVSVEIKGHTMVLT